MARWRSAYLEGAILGGPAQRPIYTLVWTRPPGVDASQVIRVIASISVNQERDQGKYKGLGYWISSVVSSAFEEAHGEEANDILAFLRPLFDNIGTFALIRLLAENPENLDATLEWDFGEIVVDEYVTTDELLHELPRELRFLLVTEGSSDAQIIGKALALRRPEIVDFFYFVNVTEGYPFSGTGNLHNFCRGLVAIGVINRTLVIYDNDAEGLRKSRASRRLNLPDNLGVIRLPDIADDKMLNSLGPTGHAVSDINGTAASIECYLDLTVCAEPPLIRWSNYVEEIDAYQGALVDRDSFVRRFLALRPNDAGYSFNKLDGVLRAIVDEATRMAGNLRVEMDAARPLMD